MSLRKISVVALAVGLVSFVAFCAAPAPPPPAAPGADTVVASLYKDFAWEVVPDHPEKPGLIDQPRAVLSRYFDESLTNLILEDRACAEKAQAICHLDFSPLWDSQDPGAKDLKVSATNDPAVVKVTFRYPGNGELMTLTYPMVKTKDGWRIHDIAYTSHESLRTILSAKM